MMMMPAARSKSRLSGILTMELAGSAIFSRAPLWPQDATTRSPTFRSVTSAPTLSMTPATSAAGENGNGGLIWYLPWIISRSKKFSAADLIAITASPGPATGSGTSVSTRSSGPQYCEQRMAFMDTPDFRTHKEGSVLHAGFEAGLQSDSGACPHGEEALCAVSNHAAIHPPGRRKVAARRDEVDRVERNETMFEKGLLAGKRILVTGGGSGLGAAMGRRFVELGAELIICGRRLELLEQTAATMRSEFGGKVATVRCDIRDGAAVDAMMDAIWHEKPIDVLVNNAAATFIAQTEHLSFRAADAILAPTLHGTMYCTFGAGRRWIEAAHKGVVLSILSTSTITGRAFTVPSAMAKSAVLAMTKSLAVEWGPKNIRTVAIAPGAFPTPGATGQLRPEGRDQGWSARNPLGRTGEHGELADLASFLICDRAGYINGEMVVQDGGAHLRGSGAEDLLQWTAEQWEKQRAGRAKG